MRLERSDCERLLANLASAASDDDGVGFESLVGTAEHAVGRLQQAAVRAEEKRYADEQALAAAWERLDDIRPQTVAAMGDAPEADLPELADQLRAALENAERAVGSGSAARAAEAVALLERLTVDGEARLDAAVIVAERRNELADALKQAMVAQGMYYRGGEKQSGRVLLHFTRPNGATYSAQISELAENGESLLTYTVAGEADLVASDVVDVAECDHTEALLESVHAALAPHGFEAGETVWVGKPQRPGRPGQGAGRAAPGRNTATGGSTGRAGTASHSAGGGDDTP
jgi:hypothetical protein